VRKSFTCGARFREGTKDAQALLDAAERVIGEGEEAIDPVQRERARKLADMLMDTATATARCEI
jgi:hypothetical protein